MAGGPHALLDKLLPLQTRRGRIELDRMGAWALGLFLRRQSCARTAALFRPSRSSPICRGVPASSKLQLLTIHRSSRTAAIAASGSAASGIAVIDALRHLGVRDIPITAETVWARAMSGAKADMAHQNDAQRRASFQ